MLAPFSSLVIYGLLIASSLFENALCCVFEKYFENANGKASFVMILVRKNVYKVLIFCKCFKFERCFESVCVCFENSKDVLV